MALAAPALKSPINWAERGTSSPEPPGRPAPPAGANTPPGPAPGGRAPAGASPPARLGLCL
eukprot:5215162-Lingulodinium_polyedra.AAC.1